MNATTIANEIAARKTLRMICIYGGILIGAAACIALSGGASAVGVPEGVSAVQEHNQQIADVMKMLGH